MSAIVKYIPVNKLTKARLQQVKRQLRKKLQGRVTSAFIFGSCSGYSFNISSDIDLIIIKKTNKSFTKRAEEFYDLLDVFPRIDILVYTPEEFERSSKQEDIGFWKTVPKQMKRLL